MEGEAAGASGDDSRLISTASIGGSTCNSRATCSSDLDIADRQAMNKITTCQIRRGQSRSHLCELVRQSLSVRVQS